MSNKLISTILPPTPNDTTSCMCTEDWNPVCGENGQTYANACWAQCDDKKVISTEECPYEKKTPCVCQHDWAPFCGVNNQTYRNVCEAKCDGQMYPCEEEGNCHLDHQMVQCKGECPCKFDGYLKTFH